MLTIVTNTRPTGEVYALVDHGEPNVRMRVCIGNGQTAEEAVASLLHDFDANGYPVPQPGEYEVVADRNAVPSGRKPEKALQRHPERKLEPAAVPHAITNVHFLSGGNAVFTVSSPKHRYTFRIRRPEPEMPYFVSLLSGPDNTRDYTYLGVYNPGQPGVRLTAKSKFTEDSTPVKAIRWAVAMLSSGKTLPEGFKIQHEGRCCRCGRVLTVPESIEAGIGPECAQRGAQ